MGELLVDLGKAGVGGHEGGLAGQQGLLVAGGGGAAGGVEIGGGGADLGDEVDLGRRELAGAGGELGEAEAHGLQQVVGLLLVVGHGLGELVGEVANLGGGALVFGVDGQGGEADLHELVEVGKLAGEFFGLAGEAGGFGGIQAALGGGELGLELEVLLVGGGSPLAAGGGTLGETLGERLEKFELLLLALEQAVGELAGGGEDGLGGGGEEVEGGID